MLKQLEEFERAVMLSHGHRCDDITASRHKQFVAAIESQISLVEATLQEAFSEEGKQPLRWVNLDKEERDDLAMFLSGTPQNPQIVNDDCLALQPSVKNSLKENNHERKDAGHNLNAASSSNSSVEKKFIDAGTINKNGEFIINIEEKETPGMRDDIICQAEKTTGTRRTWSSPNFGALRIVIADEDEQRNKLMSNIEATPKEKGSKPLFWKQKCGEHPRAKGFVNLFNQVQ